MTDTQALPRLPRGTRAAGRRLWADVLDRFELDEHELALLREAVRCVDLLDRLNETVRRDGPTITNTRGDVVTHPAAVEARQTRLVLARLIASLRLPDDDGERAQRRGAARGSYLRGYSRPRGVAS